MSPMRPKSALEIETADRELCKIQRTAQFGRRPMGVVAALQPAIRRERHARKQFDAST
ncbi:hypothetical protein RUE5091_02310 [Ruegeria denitrificans]|uniref:Uncharacterized protein n=1 Tax=Ruegeria denitrificans TaxID=1715692 RepID=A0A0P1IAS2_9RHOB|nr:hypothetical protein RUE5091_02310 [Ruegeria denitrificans]